MMRIIQFNICLLAVLTLLPLTAVANDGLLNDRFTKEKTIKKEFRVNSDALLKVSNSYGNLVLTSWNENRVVIEVHIKTSGNNEERVQEKLNDITVDFDASSNMVSAKSIYDGNKGGWNWSWGRRNNVNMQINYTIKLPVKNNVHLSNDYGSIILDRIDGHAKISCDYGRLEIGELRGRNNEISFDYTSKSTFGFINSGSISADYSGFEIAKAGNLNITADYTQATVKSMGSLQYTSDYGNLEIGDVDDVQGRGDYINVKLGDVHGNIDIEADYGSLDIGQLAPDAGNVTIRTDYTGIRIGYSSQYDFDFEITTEYADVRGRDALDINVSHEKSHERYYKGYHGRPDSGNNLSIQSDYGGISFERIN
jgi:hypothetical protein